MRVLVLGFGREDTDRLTQALAADGVRVVGAAGESAAPALVESVSPDVLVLPEGALGLALGARFPAVAAVVAVGGEAPPVAALRHAAGIAEGGAATQALVARTAPEAAAPPRVSVPPPAPPSPAAASSVTPSLGAKLAQVRFGDYHSIAEVKPGDAPFVIAEKLETLSRQYSPAGFSSRLGAEELDALLEIGRGLRDAHAVLMDPELRARYERALAEAARSAAPQRR